MAKKTEGVDNERTENRLRSQAQTSTNGTQAGQFGPSSLSNERGPQQRPNPIPNFGPDGPGSTPVGTSANGNASAVRAEAYVKEIFENPLTKNQRKL
jgi:hypothetical protein